MLVLTLKPGKSLMIGDNGDVTVTVLEVGGGRVRIGVRAPRELAVDREEVYRRKQAERRQDKIAKVRS